MPHRIFFAAGGLDRAAGRRADSAWIEARIDDPRSRVVPVWRDLSLVIPGEVPVAVMAEGERARRLLAYASERTLLGLDGEVAYFAVDLSAHESGALEALLDGARFADLREVGPVMEAREGALLAFARGMMHWHRSSRFCAACGRSTASVEGGYIRRCTGPDCGREHYPRTDPAVIMLITAPGPDGGLCLLGRQARWPERRYSTLAGFVEPGETLEAAVRREVFEETGVIVGDVRYQGSQPWPFPSSLMVGFRGLAESRAIRLNDHELQDARWFSRNDVRAFESLGYQLPRSGSIARWLISRWLEERGA